MGRNIRWVVALAIAALVWPVMGLGTQPALAQGANASWQAVHANFDAAWKAATNDVERAAALRRHLRNIQHREAVDLLVQILDEYVGKAEVETAAFESLVSASSPDVIDAIAEGMSRTRGQETTFGFALGRIAGNGGNSGMRAADKLVELAGDRKKEIQIAAIHGMRTAGQLMGARGLNVLLDILGNTRNRPEVRIPAAAALSTVGQVDKAKATDALIAFGTERRQKDDAIRQAVLSLRHLTGYDLGDDLAKWNEWWQIAKARQNLSPAESGIALPAPRTIPEYFGIQLTKLEIVFCIDTSQSMGEPVDPAMRRRYEALTPAPGANAGPQRRPLPWDSIRTKLDLAREELKRCIEELPETANIALVTYNTRATAHDAYELKPADSRTKAAIIRELDRLTPGSGPESAFTNIYAALVEALKFNLDGDKRGSVITGEVSTSGATTICLLTDGYPTWSDDSDTNGNGVPDPDELTGSNTAGTGYGKGPHADANSIIRDITKLAEQRPVQIHTIGVGDHHRQLLSTLAARTQGTYRNLNE